MTLAHNLETSAPNGLAVDPQQQERLAVQQEVVDFLKSGVAFDGQSVERIDTHISHLFLVGERVYKMKRAFQLSFLDHTSLKARRIDCEREVTFNRRTAPGIYLGVVPVTRREGGLELRGAGEPVEWLVEMKRFDQHTLFDNLIQSESLSPNLVFDLAEQIARFHLSAERTKSSGSATSNQETIVGVRRSLLKSSGTVFVEADVEAWSERINAELQSLAHFIETRRRMGFVRHCHGDMHLGNICLVGGRPTLFDAIEFNDEFSCIDVMYDIAFTVMDLIANPG